MGRHIKHSLRSGATAIAAATGLTLLSYTGQTTDGFVHTSFTGPLSAFGGSSQLPNDVVAIGDGVSDASELSALLKATAPNGVVVSDAPLTIKTTTAPGNNNELSVAPGAVPAVGAMTIKQSGQVAPASAQVLDSQGQANCSAAVSCVIDPATNATTVTFADGIVAVVQKVNDMTLVAYKSVADALSGAVQALGLPGDSIPTTIAALAPQLQIQQPAPTAPAPTPLAVAAVATPSVSAPVVQSTPAPDAAANPTSTQSPGPAPDITAATIHPRVTVSHAPSEFGAPKTGNPTGTNVSPVNPNGAANAVTNAVDAVVNAVKGALSPGAASSPSNTGAKK